LLKNNKRILIVEAKNLSIKLEKNIDQLAEYCYKSGINFGILTNGAKWLIFKTFERKPEDRIIWQMNIEKDEIEVVSQRLSLFSYHNIDKIDTLLTKNKTFDDVWQDLIKSTDSIVSIVVKHIKDTYPDLKIEDSDLKSFTEGKIEELFESAAIEEENTTEKNKIEESEFTAIEDIIFKRNTKREKISVKFPDNIIINRTKVIDTFVECIAKIGPEMVLPLNISRCGVPIVSLKKDNFYHQHKFGKYWIMAHTSTKEKIAILEEINEKLNLKLIIETFIEER